MKKNLVASVLLIIFLCFSNYNYGQSPAHGSWGISAVVNSSQADLLFPFWLGNSNTLAPSIGIVGISGVNTDISAGLVFHHYINFMNNFAPIIGARAGAIFGSPKNGNSTTDIIVGMLGGGEYFFSSNFSMGIEAQFNIVFSDKSSNRFGNPGGENFNTGSVIFATVYF